MAEHEDHDLELSRVWNELTESGFLPSTNLDSETVGLLRRLQKSANVPSPESARERVWRGLANTDELPLTDKESFMLTTTAVISSVPNGLMRSTQPISDVRRPRHGGHHLPAIAAVLIIMILSGIAGGPFTNRLGPGGLNSGPAIIAPSVPSPEAAATAETLFEITLPADVIPIGEIGTMDFHWHTIPANSVTSRTANACCPGIIVYYILDGSVTVEGDGPIQVIRHDRAGAIEDRGAGVSADLGPGDIVAVRNDDGQTWTSGASEVDVIMQTLVSGAYPAPPGANGWRVNQYTYDVHSVVLPEGPYVLRLEQVTVRSDTSFDLPANGINQLALVHKGRASIGTGTDKVLRVISVTQPVTLFVLTLSSTAEGMGTPVAGVGTAEASPVP